MASLLPKRALLWHCGESGSADKWIQIASPPPILKNPMAQICNSQKRSETEHLECLVLIAHSAVPR